MFLLLFEGSRRSLQIPTPIVSYMLVPIFRRTEREREMENQNLLSSF